MPATTISTTAYLAKQLAMTAMAASAGLGVVLPMAWLPAEPISAAFLGVIGALLRLSVPWIMDTVQKPTLVQCLLIVLTSTMIAVFGNGFQIPLLGSFFDADALWRVNTLMLAFMGITVPLYLIDLLPKKKGGVP